MPDSALPVYSVDASALIEMKEVYPGAVFQSMWEFIGKLGDQGRLVVAEQAKSECHDAVFAPWFAAHSEMVYSFSTELGEYVKALHAEIIPAGLPLIDAASTKNQGDPFVVALSLLLEGRDLTNLQTGASSTCRVVTYERNRNPGARLAKIRDVCDYYGIDCLKWPDVFQLESWSC